MMSTQWGKKIISIYKIGKLTRNRLMSSIKACKDLSKVYIEPEDLTFIIFKILF
jgi:hypothetical protein